MTTPLIALLMAAPAAAARPNIVVILADDLGWGDLGCYGQAKIKTPHLDKLASQGVRYTQAYAGSTVCGPSRCVLMTGLHAGHARVRGNGRTTLRPEDVTVARVLKDVGYVTANVGKWGLGDPGTTGVPSKQGIDHFFGYLNHGHAHNYYPAHLWRHEEKVLLRNVETGGVSSVRLDYAPDLLRDDAIRFVTENKSKPFFLYWCPVQPHANNERQRSTGTGGSEVPSLDPYAAEPWPLAEREKAATITRLDADVGTFLAKLDELGLASNTLVIFSSDNGPHKEAGNDPAFFASSGPFQGFKRSLHDGGIRVPAIARWPGKCKPGKVSDHAWHFCDLLATCCEAANVPAPATDGISFLPSLDDCCPQRSHDFLYWEFHEGGSQQAVRHGDWKAVRKWGERLRLYNLPADPGEAMDVAAANPDVVKRIEAYLATARTDNPDWPMPAPPAKKKKT
jgi:arylsulfatase A-like enzyme